MIARSGFANNGFDVTGTDTYGGDFYFANSVHGIGGSMVYNHSSFSITAKELRERFWEFTIDWWAQVLFHLRTIPRLEQIFKSNHLDVIRQPKPKSRLRARLYK